MPETSNPKPTPSWFSLSNQAIGFCIGMAVCAAVMIYAPKNYPKITEILHGIYYMAFGAALLVFIVIVGFKPYVQRFILNRAPNKVRGVIEDMQNVSDHVAIQLLNLLPTPPSEDIKTRAQAILPGLTNLLIWARLRNWWWQWILGIFVAIGGLMGTILLMNQNDLLQNQNILIQRQMSLEEASRRSALVVLMSNIMDKVDDEIKEQRSDLLKKDVSKAAVDRMKFSLTQSLIGQIAALSHSFKSYRFLDADTLIVKALSPERGQLLITLTRLPLDTQAFDNICQSSIFVRSDLRWANLNGAYLSGAKLSGANLRKAYLMSADLSGADLFLVDLSGAYLMGADLSKAYLKEANLMGADLMRADLKEANLMGANLSGADLSGADLFLVDLMGANLMGANLMGANLMGANLTINQLSKSKNLWGCTHLHDSLKLPLQQSHPHLFQKLLYKQK